MVGRTIRRGMLAQVIDQRNHWTIDAEATVQPTRHPNPTASQSECGNR
ncbi:hypothetical protein OESDEN_21911 [Oesophagostomum dentatum]|uniref:Uncharacterized protein n=1 Tax=Oesophagostomum dentatum TaxID=61180 RepID=A0A0B1RZE4_OESDE|nr:hypothetical protein OESDEN_21911 [Oesophagostomum dentatum]